MKDRARPLCLWCATALVFLLIAGCQPSPTQPPTVTLPPPTRTVVSVASLAPTSTQAPALTPRPTSTPSPLPTDTQTPVPPTKTPLPTETPSPIPPTNTATQTPIPPTKTPSPARTAKPPTPAPASAYRFLPDLPAWPDPAHSCPSCPKAPAYIVGNVTDAGGNPLAGVRLVCYNDWHRYGVIATKGGGEYDFPIIQADTTWYVVVLDQSDQPISPEAPVTVSLVESCRYILNWQRVD
jgi:hypothetical protein